MRRWEDIDANIAIEILKKIDKVEIISYIIIGLLVTIIILQIINLKKKSNKEKK